MDKYVRTLDEDIRKEEMNNKNKRHKIEILKREFDEINQRFILHKEQTQKQIKEYFHFRNML